MREMKFRGICGLVKRWIYGSLNVGFEGCYYSIFVPGEDIDKEYPVIEETVGQYTGLKDKNGKEIYEGDIIRCSKGCPHEVIWLQEYGGTYFGGMPAWYLSGISEGYAWTGSEEVVGNVYENPELLEAAE